MKNSYTDWKKEITRFRSKNTFLDPRFSFIDFFIWRRTRFQKNQNLENPLPWLTNKTIDFLKSFKRDRSNIFEWGSGASTLWYAQQGHKVYAVEHDKEWYEYLLNHSLYQKNKSNIDIAFISPENSNDKSEYSISSSRMPGCDLSDYVNVIQKHDYNYFDLIVVDGRARVHCLNKALDYLKKGGWIILDNADRKDYMLSTEFPNCLLEWHSLDLSGVVYGYSHIVGAKAWRKPE